MKSYTGAEIANLIGATENHIKHWANIRLIVPSVQAGTGRGRPRLYDFSNLFAGAVAVRLNRFGVPSHRIGGTLELLDALRTGELPTSWGKTPAERLRYFAAVVPDAGKVTIIGAPAARAQELQAEFDARRAAGQPWRLFLDPNTRDHRALFALLWQPELWPVPRLMTDRKSLLEWIAGESFNEGRSAASMVLNLSALLMALERASGDSFVGTLEERLARAEGGSDGR